MIIPSFKELKEVADSRYELAILVSKRARKLIDGNPPLIDTDSEKPVTIAIEEIMAGKIKFGDKLSDSQYEKKIAEEKEAKKQKKYLSEFCRERILNPHKQIPSEKSTEFIHSADIDKKLTTLNKNLIVLFNEIKALQQNQLEMRKQVYYNSSYLYFLTHELFADNPEIAHKIDEKIKNLNFNYDNSSTDKNIK